MENKEKICILKYNKNKKEKTKFVLKCDNKTVKFGHRDYEQFYMTKDQDQKRRFYKRHLQNYKNGLKIGPLNKTVLATELLWQEKTLPKAIQKYNKKHNMKIVFKE